MIFHAPDQQPEKQRPPEVAQPLHAPGQGSLFMILEVTTTFQEGRVCGSSLPIVETASCLIVMDSPRRQGTVASSS